MYILALTTDSPCYSLSSFSPTSNHARRFYVVLLKHIHSYLIALLCFAGSIATRILLLLRSSSSPPSPKLRTATVLRPLLLRGLVVVRAQRLRARARMLRRSTALRLVVLFWRLCGVLLLCSEESLFPRALHTLDRWRIYQRGRSTKDEHVT